ncbi:xylulokinase [Pseudonocardia sp. TRM90224]|uniref:xylulokinase n=1 Tax=Pseudonocardia sp. TRM90224 TaxID=2812678 RepID=UPI001E651F8B|nr:FGGY family carbohydrate kinase [Pseudonocardia sp. TRM90224]
MASVLLGVDVGTSSVKIVATGTDGALIAEATAPHALSTAGGGAEQDPDDWWRTVTALAPQVVAGHDVLGVAVTSQAPTLVPVGADTAATGPALTWLDRRAVDDARRLADIAPSRNGPDPYFGTGKLPWLRRERPDIAGRTHRVVAANGYIVLRLTGGFSLDDTTASLMQGFDEAAGRFDERLAGHGVELLPEVVAPTTVVGGVTSAAAAATGIPEGTPVVAGGSDAVGACLEAGSLAVGDPVVEMTGFSTVTMLPVAPGTHVPGFIHCRSALPSVDLLITAQVTSGAAVDWLNGLVDGSDLRESGPLLERDRPSRLTVVPSLAGERTPGWDPHARGTVDGIDLDTDAVELMLATLEGSALALADDLEQVRRHGFELASLRCTGGGARSPAWLQIKADATGLPVLRPAAGHGAAQGASYLAGVALGHYGAGEVRGFAAKIESRHVPDPALTARYREKLVRFRETVAFGRHR